MWNGLTLDARGFLLCPNLLLGDQALHELGSILLVGLEPFV